MPEIVIYTTQYCPYCISAKRFFNSQNLPYQEIDITNKDEMWDMLQKKTRQQTVPQIFFDGKSIGGYEDMMELYRSNLWPFPKEKT
jgi:glutaredoxin 3